MQYPLVAILFHTSVSHFLLPFLILCHGMPDWSHFRVCGIGDLQNFPSQLELNRFAITHRDIDQKCRCVEIGRLSVTLFSLNVFDRFSGRIAFISSWVIRGLGALRIVPSFRGEEMKKEKEGKELWKTNKMEFGKIYVDNKKLKIKGGKKEAKKKKKMKYKRRRKKKQQKNRKVYKFSFQSWNG